MRPATSVDCLPGTGPDIPHGALTTALVPDDLPPPFTGLPWARKWSVDLPPEAVAVPTMLSDEEARMLFWLARDHATGAGAICDLGCFVGGSTARLAAGAAAAAHGADIHAFDHFTISDEQKESHLYAAGVAPFAGRNMLATARDLLQPWSEQVHLHQGDINRLGWQGGPIDLLFIDAAKRPAVTDRIARDFYPHLVPGRSVIVHQDYFHWRQPWIPAQVELLSHCLEIVGWCRKGSIVARVTAPFTHEDLTAARTDGLSDETLSTLLARALRRFPGPPMQAHLARAILAVRHNPGIRVPARMDRTGLTKETIAAVIAETARDGPLPQPPARK